MKIKRFVAQDMRQALRMVKDALGDDAVILSNKTVEDGVELTAAVDLITEDHEQAADAAPMQANKAQASAIQAALETREASTKAAPIKANPHRRAAQANQPQQRSPSRSQAQPRGRAQPRQQRHEEPQHQAAGLAAALSEQAQAASSVDEGALAEMREEMYRMRRWLQAELSSMHWYDLGQRSPNTQELLSRLMGLGLSADLARRLSERVAGIEDLELAWKKALFFLSGEIQIHEEEILERGGIVALVGPTGVGKTTTIAKMAARFALRHGHRNVALVTTDNFRIGARDQLHTYGRILNVPVRSATDPAAMRDVIDSLSDRRLILIDTAGMGVENERLTEQLETLNAVGPALTTLLTLSATTEGMALTRAFRLFAQARPDACLLTKLDEAGSLGGSLSALINSGLPLAFMADGQRVPEDLQVARAQPLVKRAAELFEEHASQCDQTFVALSYRGDDANARV